MFEKHLTFKLPEKTKAQQLGVTDFPYNEYDSNGRMIYSERIDKSWWKREYNDRGNETYFEHSDGEWRRNEFDSQGRLIKKIDGDGIKTYTYVNDGECFVLATTNNITIPTSLITVENFSKLIKAVEEVYDIKLNKPEIYGD